MTDLESIISAMCITSVVAADDLSDAIKLDNDESFRLFLTPASEGELKAGDVVTVGGVLPYSGDDEVNIPVVLGRWSEVLFKTVKLGEAAETVEAAYMAPIKNYKQ